MENRRAYRQRSKLEDALLLCTDFRPPHITDLAGRLDFRCNAPQRRVARGAIVMATCSSQPGALT